MDVNQLFFKNSTKKEWDHFVFQIPNASFLHSWFWINYQSGFSNIIDNLSFLLFDSNNKLLAVCPIAISINYSKSYNEISFGGNPCGTPALIETRPNLNRKILDQVFDLFKDYIIKHEVKKVNFVWDPLTMNFCLHGKNHENHFELLRFQLQCSVQNMQLLDLRVEDNNLFENISKYHKRHIKRTEKKGVEIKIIDLNTDKKMIEEVFDDFKQAHFISAGSLTRPLETWYEMLASIQSDNASLFIAYINQAPISYLLCGQFAFSAFGWSQVNVDEFESEYSPRHLLEWSAIKYYKNLGYKFYELGYRFFGNQIYYLPTEKEVSISIFKERFGGYLYPQIRWTGYFDKELLINELNIFHDNFIKQLPVIKFSNIY